MMFKKNRLTPLQVRSFVPAEGALNQLRGGNGATITVALLTAAVVYNASVAYCQTVKDVIDEITDLPDSKP